MPTVAFDTLRAAERLKAAGFTEDQAKAPLRTPMEAFAQALPLQDLVTRDYLDARLEALRHELKGDIEALRGELKGDIERVRGDLIRWLAGLLIAQAGVIVALVKLLG